MGRVVDPDVVDGGDEPIVDAGSSATSADTRAPAENAGEAEAKPRAVGTLPPPPAPPPDRSDLLDATDAPFPPPPQSNRGKAPPALASTSSGTNAAVAQQHDSKPAASDSATSASATEGEANAISPAEPSSPSQRDSSPSQRDSERASTNSEERESRLSAGGIQRTGHPVRDRLLAKAAQAEAQARPLVDSNPLPAFSSLDLVSQELDEIAAPRSGESSSLRIGGATLSSTNLLLFGTVTGLALIASLFTLLIKFAPQQPGDAAVRSLPPTPPAAAVAPQATTEAVPSVAPPPPRKKIEGPWRITEPKSGQRKISGKIGQEPFLKAIQTAGLSKAEAYRVYTALKDERNLDRCAPRHEFQALVDRSSGRVVAFEYIVSREEIYQAKEGDNGLLVGKQLDMKVARNRVQGALLFSGSFEAAARAAHLDPSLLGVMNKALEGHTSVAQFKRGDRVRVVAQEVSVLGEFHRYAGLEALEYLPVSGDPLRVYYFNTRKRYYDAKGRAPGEGGWRKPVKGAPITSKFNPQRLHPILKKRMPHNGTDFGAPTGTPVYASSYGTITKRGDYGANGNFIAIAHPNDYETGYSHLSRFEPGLKVGDKVERMQVIGYVGSTGRSTGPHLHFSAKHKGAFIDPESLKLDALTVLPAAERATFAKVRQQYDELLEAVALPPALDVTPESVAEADDAQMLSPDADEFDEDPGSDEPPAAPVAQPSTPTLPTAPAVGSTIVANARATAPVVTGVSQAGYRSLYLSDKELMESQSANDEGEVEE